jgi:hypothetical protein
MTVASITCVATVGPKVAVWMDVLDSSPMAWNASIQAWNTSLTVFGFVDRPWPFHSSFVLIRARRPIHCCLYTICAPCGQWILRRQLLDYDMTKYKLWQGYHDGPKCCATRCPGAPITIESGTYGESKCPNAFLCAEVWCLGCIWSACCSFDVNRRMIKAQRNLGEDPTKVRVIKCIGFFSRIMQSLFQLACCVCIASCCIGCCAPDSEGAQECSGEGSRASGACFSCARTIWKGIWSVKVIAMGCMSTQMDVEMKQGQPLVSQPTKQIMQRGGDDTLDDDEDPDAWWKKPA